MPGRRKKAFWAVTIGSGSCPQCREPGRSISGKTLQCSAGHEWPTPKFRVRRVFASTVWNLPVRLLRVFTNGNVGHRLLREINPVLAERARFRRLSRLYEKAPWSAFEVVGWTGPYGIGGKGTQDHNHLFKIGLTGGSLSISTAVGQHGPGSLRRHEVPSVTIQPDGTHMVRPAPEWEEQAFVVDGVERVFSVAETDEGWIALAVFAGLAVRVSGAPGTEPSFALRTAETIEPYVRGELDRYEAVHKAMRSRARG